MGYEVHVTRASAWWDSDEEPITLEEWRAYVDPRADLRLDGAAEAPLEDGTSLRYESEGLAVWTGYSGHGEDGNMAWLDHRGGRLVVKNPDEEILAELVRIAGALQARVQGDDGELYGDEGMVLPAEGEPGARREPDGTKPGLFARLFGWLRRDPVPEVETPFRKGRRYRDRSGEICTVVELDPGAEHGLGRVTFRFEDGRELSLALAGEPESLFTPVD